MLGSNMSVWGLPLAFSTEVGRRTLNGRITYTSQFPNGCLRCAFPRCKMTIPYDRDYCGLHRCNEKGCDQSIYCSEHFKCQYMVN